MSPVYNAPRTAVSCAKPRETHAGRVSHANENGLRIDDGPWLNYSKYSSIGHLPEVGDEVTITTIVGDKWIKTCRTRGVNDLCQAGAVEADYEAGSGNTAHEQAMEDAIGFNRDSAESLQLRGFKPDRSEALISALLELAAELRAMRTDEAA